MPPPEERPLRLLISFSPKDQELKDQLVQHLQVLVRFAGVDLWTADQIRAGENWREKLDEALGRADVALVLISSDFLASAVLQDDEVPKLFARHEQGSVTVIPVLIRSCLWQAHPWLNKLKPLPTSEQPIASFQGDARDRALTEVAAEIARRARASSVRSASPDARSSQQTRTASQAEGETSLQPAPNVTQIDAKFEHAASAAVAVGTSPQAHGTLNMPGMTVNAGTVIFAGASAAGQPATALVPIQSSRPTPNFPDDHTRILSEQLASAKLRRLRLQEHGRDTARAAREILDLKRQLREGGQLRAGDSLGSNDRYELLDLLGRGGFASVWLAYDNERCGNVAIKVLHSNLAGDRVRLDRFKRGARIMSELKHEAVVRVLEPYGIDGGWHYFVMECMGGGDLRRSVVEKRINPEQAIVAILRISGALAEAHARGIIHRDVKPANILLDDNLESKLTDFDLVGVGDTTGGTRTGALGTLIYSAPELMSRPMDADARADVFGLGMTAVFCISGNDLPGNILGRADRFIEALSCSPEVKSVLKRATDWDDHRARYADATAFQEALATALLVVPQGMNSSSAGPANDEAVSAEQSPDVNAPQQKRSMLRSAQIFFQSLPDRFVAKASETDQSRQPSVLELLTNSLYVATYARSYLKQAKMSEAKNTLGAIVSGLQACVEREDEHGRRAERFPSSAPPTPPDIPRGVKAVPDETTWSHPTWETIKFSMSSPVYLSYEIDTSPDGRTAVARARGDLGGDGKIIIFERTVSFGPDGKAIASPEVITREAVG